MLNLLKKTVFVLASCIWSVTLFSQNSNNELNIDTNTRFQTMEGFGASLAFYEGWLTAHPNKNEIYDAIFKELSLDILRVRNAYDYDPTMINRVKEFVQAAENSLGAPIKVLSTSWGPPAYLKSNNDRQHGGTLKYTVGENGVEIDYSGFADWWSESLDEYNANDIFPAYISLQNEPDWSADYESCRFDPAEKINATDTIAGYNKALKAIYNMVEQRSEKPKILGPETIGVGYNSLQNYVNNLNTDYLYGIAHHLYHGVDEDNPWISTDIAKAGELHPKIPHFQTEYSRGDWFSLGGLMYKSLNDENVVAYLYWDLIWTGAGLVDLEFPWDRNRWTTQKGYIKTKEFYSFKQFSAFIHPGWQRINTTIENDNIKSLGFINSDNDSVSLVIINRSNVENIDIKIKSSTIDILQSEIYQTSENENCSFSGALNNSEISLPKKSITTIKLVVEAGTTGTDEIVDRTVFRVYPNPFSKTAVLKLPHKISGYKNMAIIDSRGKIVRQQSLANIKGGKQIVRIDRNGLKSGIYFYKVESDNSAPLAGKFIITD